MCPLQALALLDALLVGETADHLRIINVPLGEGRFFTYAEDTHRREYSFSADRKSAAGTSLESPELPIEFRPHLV